MPVDLEGNAAATILYWLVLVVAIALELYVMWALGWATARRPKPKPSQLNQLFYGDDQEMPSEFSGFEALYGKSDPEPSPWQRKVSPPCFVTPKQHERRLYDEIRESGWDAVKDWMR